VNRETEVTMKISSKIIAIVVPVILFGGIAVSAALNMWVTESTKIPITYTDGEFAGEYNPADIRGSYSLGDIENAFKVPVDVLARAFGVAGVENPSGFLVKGLEDMYAGLASETVEVGTDSVRAFVALYRGLPYTPEEDTVLPNPAASQLRALGTLSEDQLAWLEAHRVDIADVKPEAVAADHETSNEEDRTIRGKTTFGELLEWGVTKEQIEAILAMPIGARGTAVRDYFIDKGLEFSTYKTQLQELVDSVSR
jgi:hypothetical protein